MCAGAHPSTINQVIIWLNGTFGAGKTSTAERLAALIPGSRVIDPETVGLLLRANLGDLAVADFQDWPAWPPLVAATLTEVARMTGEHLIAPQTVMKQEYLDQIFAALRAAELDVFHVVLDAADAVLRSRIEGLDEAQLWRLEHLDQYRESRPWMVEAADFVVDTAASTPPQIARRILNAVPGLPARPEAAGKPKPAEPKAAGSKAAEPKPAEPKPAEPKAAEPKAGDQPRPGGQPKAAEKAGLEDQPKAGLAEKASGAEHGTAAGKVSVAKKANGG
jgi:chloramphenicol 3-O-phosphotransferase